jgi:rubrerythrin
MHPRLILGAALLVVGCGISRAEFGAPDGRLDMSSTTVTLSSTEEAALRDALDDEQRAWATYDQVIADQGAVRPFINIVEAEARHIGTLEALFATYGLDVPENPWVGAVPRYPSVSEACKAGVVAEIENVKLYDRLFERTQRPEILAVFRNLRAASEERHLPAFERRLARGDGGGRGTARGRGGGRGR